MMVFEKLLITVPVLLLSYSTAKSDFGDSNLCDLSPSSPQAAAHQHVKTDLAQVLVAISYAASRTPWERGLGT